MDNIRLLKSSISTIFALFVYPHLLKQESSLKQECQDGTDSLTR